MHSATNKLPGFQGSMRAIHRCPQSSQEENPFLKKKTFHIPRTVPIPLLSGCSHFRPSTLPSEDIITTAMKQLFPEIYTYRLFGINSLNYYEKRYNMTVNLHIFLRSTPA